MNPILAQLGKQAGQLAKGAFVDVEGGVSGAVDVGVIPVVVVVVILAAEVVVVASAVLVVVIA